MHVLRLGYYDNTITEGKPCRYTTKDLYEQFAAFNVEACFYTLNTESDDVRGAALLYKDEKWFMYDINSLDLAGLKDLQPTAEILGHVPRRSYYLRLIDLAIIEGFDRIVCYSCKHKMPEGKSIVGVTRFCASCATKICAYCGAESTDVDYCNYCGTNTDDDYVE